MAHLTSPSAQLLLNTHLCFQLEGSDFAFVHCHGAVADNSSIAQKTLWAVWESWNSFLREFTLMMSLVHY